MKPTRTQSRLARAVGAALFASVAALAALASASCTVDAKATFVRKAALTGKRANSVDFQNNVSVVFEKRCGTLDCHGTIARNLRIYSSGGLRIPNEAGITPGGGATTLEEINANYESLLNLEPEQTNEVLFDNADPHTLLILKKPLQLEHHKGGPAITRGDDAETCILSWLQEDASNPFNATACTNAATFPKN
jgi:hypothetical protein